MKTVIADRMVFINGTRVPAGTPFEVPDKAKLEPGMAYVEKRKAEAKATAPGEPQTLAEVAAAEAEGTEPKGAEGQARV